MPAHKSWRIEDPSNAIDAADAAPEQMNSFVQSKTDVLEKIEESLRPLCMVENLNDDEIMELCILSNELNACETAAVLNPSKFASIVRRGLNFVNGFAVDLTTARANGTMWDLSLEDDKAELRRVQNREQPELLVGSPPSDEFSSLLNTCAEAREISKLRTEKIEPQIRACVQSYKLQMEMRKHFVHEHPELSSSWEMHEVQSLINDPKSLQHRWSDVSLEFENSRIEKQNRVHEKANEMSHKFRQKMLKYFVEMVDGNVTRDLFT